MPDPRFFRRAGPLRLSELAGICGASLSDGADPDKLIHDVAPLDAAGPEDLSFFDNRRYLKAFEASRAGACMVEPKYAARAPAGMALILTQAPYKAYALAAARFYPKPAATASIHPTAVIDDTAIIGEDVAIGAYAVIGPRVEIGARCVIRPQAVIAEAVVIGEDSEIGAGASLAYCLIGRNCQIHAGARIGNRGFGFAITADGPVDVPQLGRVIVEDGVEIGANATVDRGAGPDTVIGAGSKIDNLVQLGHNVRIGRECVLVAQSGVAGSSILEDQVVIAAQGGVGGHLTMQRGSRLAAKSGLMRDVAPGETVGGLPAMALRDYFRLVAMWKRQLKETGKKND